jgi:hypothetical protein
MSRNQLPDLLEDADGDSFDLSLYLVDQARGADGRLTVTAKALFDRRRVGLQIVLGTGWKALDAGGIPVHKGEVVYRSIGEESDRLLVALAGLCACPGAAAMKQEVEFTAVALEGDPTADPPRALKLKLFFESGGPKCYAEIYTNLDPAQRRVEIREKDADYRRPLLAALSARPARAPRAPLPARGGVRAARSSATIDSKLANLRRRAAKGDLEVEHLVAFAVGGDRSAAPAIRELKARHKWPHSHLVGGRHVVPLGRWADVTCSYLEGGCDALLAYARRPEADAFSFAVHVLSELKSAPAAAALAELSREVAAALPRRLAEAKTLADAISVTMSFDGAPALDRPTAATIRSFLHRLLSQDLNVPWRLTAVYALRGVGDEDSIRLISSMPPAPEGSRDALKVIKIIRKRLGASGG